MVLRASCSCGGSPVPCWRAAAPHPQIPAHPRMHSVPAGSRYAQIMADHPRDFTRPELAALLISMLTVILGALVAVTILELHHDNGCCSRCSSWSPCWGPPRRRARSCGNVARAAEAVVRHANGRRAGQTSGRNRANILAAATAMTMANTGGTPMPSNRETNPSCAVLAGSEVRTLDGQKIGVVAELRGRYFKIKTGRFQQDYWLRTDSVRSAEPQQAVVLNVSKARLDEIKMVDIEHLD